MSEEGVPDFGHLIPRERDMRWAERAECQYSDPRLFHPEDYAGSTRWRRRLEAEAKLVCAGCPVRGECLKDAIDLKDTWGIRAGMTGPERRKLLRAA